MKKRVFFALGLFLMVLATSCSDKNNESDKSAAASFPTKPIDIIVPWGAGGGTDVFVRTLSVGAQKYMGQPWNIINRGGAGGTIATTEFLTAKNDGYSVIIEAIGVFSTQPKMNKVSYTYTDFEPLIGTTVDPILLVTNNQTNIKTPQDLLAYVNMETVKWGYTGKGSLHHIGWTAVLGDMAKKVNGVSYDGGGELMSALLGNHIQFASLHPVNIKSHEDSDSFVPLLVLSSERLAEYPDVPTAKEFGLDYEFEVWKFFMVPKGTDPEIKAILSDGIQKMMDDPEIRESLSKSGSTFLKENDADAVAEKLKNNVEATGKVLDMMGLSVN